MAKPARLKRNTRPVMPGYYIRRGHKFRRNVNVRKIYRALPMLKGGRVLGDLCGWRQEQRR